MPALPSRSLPCRDLRCRLAVAGRSSTLAVSGRRHGHPRARCAVSRHRPRRGPSDPWSLRIAGAVAWPGPWRRRPGRRLRVRGARPSAVRGRPACHLTGVLACATGNAQSALAQPLSPSSDTYSECPANRHCGHTLKCCTKELAHHRLLAGDTLGLHRLPADLHMQAQPWPEAGHSLRGQHSYRAEHTPATEQQRWVIECPVGLLAKFAPSPNKGEQDRGEAFRA